TLFDGHLLVFGAFVEQVPSQNLFFCGVDIHLRIESGQIPGFHLLNVKITKTFRKKLHAARLIHFPTHACSPSLRRQARIRSTFNPTPSRSAISLRVSFLLSPW